jgi:hypothetical protein
MKHRETFLHLFRTCPVVSNTLLHLNVRCRLKWDINNCHFDSIYWYGDCAGNLDRNVLLFYDIFRYQIWAMKIRRTVDTNLLNENVLAHLKSIFTVKPSIKTAFIKNNHLSNILQAMG